MSRVCDDHEPVVITGRGAPAVVMLSRDDFKALEETAFLLPRPGRMFATGIGKLEPLHHALAGTWSRRIDDEHRIVYKPGDESLLIAQLRYHY